MRKINLIGLLAGVCFSCNQQNQPIGTTDNDTRQEEATTVTTQPISQPEGVRQNVGNTVSFDFEEAPEGKLPENWSAHKTGKGSEINWGIVNDSGNKVLAQLAGDNPNNHFNVAVNDSITARNVSLQARLKSLRGRMDQGGGFVWRFQDPGNYYVVRANPLEDNVVLYKVEKGKRTDLPLVGQGRTYGTKTEVQGDGWNDLRLEARDSLFTVYYNEMELFRVIDKTFPQAGKVGFWTKADAVTYFDDLQVEVLP
ncbi:MULTISPECIES: hypothetical protein [Pontibacter]|uniref:DUF1080 domain-containing protein n=2 Tax=Pontibacter TaxID=323449 RepID=A0A5C8K8T4_9BACT|nr:MULTISPECIES: hypothetical protein [Pontibacter]PVY38341.1 hypothetical protein C8E01_11741 [Pontibacter virosus]QCR25271.1 hypothetical protein C1N53_22385 [Pontibacter sp. SGAir0037]TXK50041.1 hypothetical protein FVR03_05410 [Pontibacter qinzhouensis]